jgi:nitrate reductase beta subunit
MERRATARSTRWRWSGRWPCRCTPSTARCRWSGTCRRCRRSVAAANAGHVGTNGEIPDVNQLRIPVKYLANLLTAGDTVPVVGRWNACWPCAPTSAAKHVDGTANHAAIEQVKLSVNQVEEMYR